MLLEKIGFRVQKLLSRFNRMFRLRSEHSSVIFIKTFQVVTEYLLSWSLLFVNSKISYNFNVLEFQKKEEKTNNLRR